jgi:hypothetical protein
VILDASQSSKVGNSSQSDGADASEMLNSTVSINSSEVLNASKFTKILDSTNASQSYVTEISNSANTLDPSESLNVTGSADTVYSETSQILDASVVVNSS